MASTVAGNSEVTADWMDVLSTWQPNLWPNSGSDGDDADADLKEEEQKNRQIYLASCLIAIVAVGNVLVVMAVCLYEFLKTPLNVLLVGLSLANLLLCVTTPANLYFIYTFKVGKLNMILTERASCLFNLWSAQIFLTLTTLTLLVITLERLLAALAPAKHAAWVTMKNSKVALLLIWVISILLCLPAIAGWNTWQFLACSYDRVYSSVQLYGFFVVPIMTLMVGAILACGAALVINHLGGDTDQFLLSKMMSVIIAEFLLGNVPAIGFTVHFMLTKYADFADLKAYYNSCQALVLCTSAAHPIIMCFMNAGFAKGFRKLFGCGDNIVEVVSGAISESSA